MAKLVHMGAGSGSVQRKVLENEAHDRKLPGRFSALSRSFSSGVFMSRSFGNKRSQHGQEGRYDTTISKACCGIYRHPLRLSSLIPAHHNDTDKTTEDMTKEGSNIFWIRTGICILLYFISFYVFLTFVSIRSFLCG